VFFDQQFTYLQLMPTPVMSCSRTKGLPGLPPIPTGEGKEKSAIYEVCIACDIAWKLYLVLWIQLLKSY